MPLLYSIITIALLVCIFFLIPALIRLLRETKKQKSDLVEKWKNEKALDEWEEKIS